MLREYDLKVLESSRHVEGFAREQREEVERKKKRCVTNSSRFACQCHPTHWIASDSYRYTLLHPLSLCCAWSSLTWAIML